MSLLVHQLTKSYGPQRAVDHVSFEIHKGEIVGFLGPNGAGKSTTMKMIVGYLQPDSGTISLNGLTLEQHALTIKKQIGYLPESNALYDEMYVKEYLSFLAAIHKIESPPKRINEVIELTGLGPMQGKKIAQLSKGYKQRLGIAGSIIHQPALLLLDEPTAGLDPNQLVEIRALIKLLSAQCMILFSTHILQEVSAICSRVLVLHQGKLVANEPIDTLLKSDSNTITVVFDQDITPFFKDFIQFNNDTQQLDIHTLVACSNDANALKNKIMGFALEKGLSIQRLQTQSASLEEIFKLLTH